MNLKIYIMFIKKYIPSPIIDIFKFNWTKDISTPIHDHMQNMDV